MPKWRLRSKSELSANTSAALNPNHNDSSPHKYIILSKISCVMTYAIAIHFMFMILYVSIINFNLTEPGLWLQSTLYSIMSFVFWIYPLPIICIIFLQTAINSTYLQSRMDEDTSLLREFISDLSVKMLFIILHVIGGGCGVWLYLSLSEDQYSALYEQCGNTSCLQEGGLFLILNGACTGLYFSLRFPPLRQIPPFPVIPQSKFSQFKSEFSKIVEESKWFALYSTIYFIVLYFALSPTIYEMCSLFGVHLLHQQFGITLYFVTWIFSCVYVVHACIFEFLFKLFLTEQIQLPLTKTHRGELTLVEALTLDTMPILQQLASLDLYLLSMWSPQRRQILYTLSQPGGHPHIWNRLIEVILSLVNCFTEALNSSIESGSGSDLTRSVSTQKTSNSLLSLQTQPVQYRSIRARLAETQTNNSIQIQETVMSRFAKMLTDVLDYIRNIGIIKQIFGVSADGNIQDILKSGQTIELMILALSNIVVKSVDEDQFGVIQKNVPDIIMSLYDLKVALEKLNKSSMLVKKNSNHSSVKVSNSVHSATKRSLIKICRRFRNYLHEFNLKKDTVGHLKTIV